MKRLALLPCLALSSLAQVDIRLNSRSPYVDVGRGLVWGTSGRGGIQNNFLFTPINPDQGICVFVANNNPTNSHAITLQVFQTGDSQQSSYTGTTGRFVQDTLSNSITSVAAASMVSTYVHTNAAATAVISISGTSSAAGTPDTADVFLVQTSHTSCGPDSPVTQRVSGPVASGQTQSGGPVASGGVDSGGLVRNFHVTNLGDLGIFPASNGCGTTPFNAALQAVPTSSTAIASATTCAWMIFLANTTASALAVTLTDNQGSPVTALPAFSIPGNSTLIHQLWGMKFTSGIKWSATGAGVTGAIVGLQ